MHIGVIQDTTKTLEVEWGTVWIIEVVMFTIWEVIKGTGEITILERGNYRNQSYDRNRSRSFERQE